MMAFSIFLSSNYTSSSSFHSSQLFDEGLDFCKEIFFQPQFESMEGEEFQINVFDMHAAAKWVKN